MRNKQINIVKASGKTAPFSEEKFIQSLLRSGADRKLAASITEEVLKSMYDGMSTKEIYRIGFERLRKHSGHAAARYRLKNAIMDLGPSGFPFEKFIGEILKRMGYSAHVGGIVKGKCVNHEIDIVAEKGNEHFMIECKYHNQPGTVSNVKIPLYIQSRFQDVKETWLQLPGHAAKFHQGWVVTNTKFSVDAIQYGTCAGLYLLGWDYPHNNSLRSLIDKFGLYPLTCLTTLTKSEKHLLLKNDVVLCKDLCADEDHLRRIGIRGARLNAILVEGNELCANLLKHEKH